MSCSEYPASLKYADITLIFKKDDKTDKTNYRPICILSNLSKIYERFMQNQMYPHLNQIFSKYQCGFRKGYNAQHCLMAMIEKWRKFLDIGGHADALLIDLSKAFDCIDHEVLIAKIHAYGFDNGCMYMVVNSLFEFTNKNYNIRNASILKRKRHFTVYYGRESFVSVAPKIWELVPDSIGELKTLSTFKNKIKAWTTDKCPCRLCKNYIGQVGFI